MGQHPPASHNPHIYPLIRIDADGNQVTVHGTENQGGGSGWAGLVGTDSSTSSSTAATPSRSTEDSTPRPAPDAESQSESDLTTPSTASSTDGDGTEPKTAPTRPSGKSK